MSRSGCSIQWSRCGQQMCGVIGQRQSGIEVNPDAINQSLGPHVPAERVRCTLVTLDIDQAGCPAGRNPSRAKHGHQQDGVFGTIPGL